jgi:3-methyladenine DNA glycosylase AlkC
MSYELRDFYDEAVIREIARDIKRVARTFPDRRFVAACLDGLAPLSLTGRAAHIAGALRQCLPDDFAQTARILERSLGPRHAGSETFGMAPFKYLPHTMYVAEHGLGHFEDSMRLQCELTQRFCAEFSIRTFLNHHPEATYARLVEWARHPDVHVRRLVSEGSRPRLPWAPRLRRFQEDPAPVLALLEMLKDDPELYVRRSVANNLNDIAKDHAAVVVDTCRRWLRDSAGLQADVIKARRWIVGHALRSLVKQGHQGALDLLGAGRAPKIRLASLRIAPKRVAFGGTVVLTCAMESTASRDQDLLVDYAVHYVKASGSASAKVFKLKRVTLAPKEALPIALRVTLKDLTTRKHYPGRHVVELIVNGRRFPAGAFTLLPRR